MEQQKLPQLPEGWQHQLGGSLTPEQLAKFERLYQLVLAGNQRLNLTRITEPGAFLEKHLWDSLQGIAAVSGPEVSSPEATPADFANPDAIQQLLPNPDSPATVIDIGTGAGFPGVPVAIARPQWQVTLLDSTQKKIKFIDTLLADLALTNAHTRNDRAEYLARKVPMPSFDLALVRAVGTAEACAAYALPLLKSGGTAVLYRGHWSAADTAALQEVVQPLGGRFQSVVSWQTPLSQSVHSYVYVQKR